MKKRDYVLLNYTGCRIHISKPPTKNIPKNGGELHLEPLGKPKIEVKSGIFPGEDTEYQLYNVSGLTPPIGIAVYIVMPELAGIICSVRKDVFIPVDYFIDDVNHDPLKPGIRDLHCRTIARFCVETQSSWT